MKPVLTLGISLATALTGGCTKYLQIEHVQALTDLPGAPLKGVPYALFFDQFEIETTAKLTTCATFTLETGASLVEQTAHPDPAFSYMIDPNSMAGLLHSSKFDIEYNPDGSVASVNAEVEDHTPAVVLGLAKAAAGIVSLGASGAVSAVLTEKANFGPPKIAPVSTCLPMSKMRKAIARRLTESKSTIPHFYVRRRVRADSSSIVMVSSCMRCCRNQVNVVLRTMVSNHARASVP